MKNNLFEKIITPSMLLEPLTEADYSEEYLTWLNDEFVNRYLETRWEKQTEEKIKSFIRAIEMDHDCALYRIIVNNTHIGNIKLGPINWNNKYADIGYLIGNRNYWGKGLATEAVAMVTKFAFEELELNKCVAGVYLGNIASAKVLEKVGFTLEGCLKEQLNGSSGWEDHLLYGYLRKDFKKNE